MTRPPGEVVLSPEGKRLPPGEFTYRVGIAMEIK